MNEELKQLRHQLDNYLRDEGLFDLMSPERQPVTPELSRLWLLWDCVVFAVIVSQYMNWLMTGLMTLLAFLLIMLGFMAHSFIYPRVDVMTKNIRPLNVGLFIVTGVGFPALLSGGLLLMVSNSAWSSILYLFLYLVTGSIAVAFTAKEVRLHHVYSAVQAAFRVSLQAFDITFSILPLLVVIVILSLFSAELWQVLGGISMWLAIVCALLVFVPAYLSVVLSSRDDVLVRAREGSDESWVLSTALKVVGVEQLPAIVWLAIEWELKHFILPSKEHKKLIKAKATRWAWLLTIMTSVILVAVFTLYFYLLINLLLNEQVIEIWLTNIAHANIPTITIFGYRVYVFGGPIGNVCLFFGFLVGGQALTNDGVRTTLKLLLQQKVAHWLSASSVLLACTLIDRRIARQ